MRKSYLAFLAIMVTGISACGSEADPGSASNASSVASQSDPLRIASKEVATQVNLIADQPGVAPTTDPELVNAWGLAFNPKGPAWISANGTGLSPVYDSTGKRLLRVVIPPPKDGMPPSAPTGQVFNTHSDSSFQGDLFIFVTEDGTISGWQPSDGNNAMLRVDNSKNEAIYKGVAIASHGSCVRLFAADFHNNKVDVFDNQYQPVYLQDAFVDRKLPPGYAPFNIFAHDGILLVSYALQDEDKEDDVAGPGHGFIDVYDADGRLLERLVSGGALNSPWGMAVKLDKKWHRFPELIVGNFGDGHINVYQLSFRHFRLEADFQGQIVDKKRQPIVIDGLWALMFGPGAGGFSADDLFFTAGPDDEQHGLFGKLVFP